MATKLQEAYTRSMIPQCRALEYSADPQQDGESGRRGIHPWHFLRIGFRSTSTASMICNALWPFVPAAIALHFARPDLHVWIFALNYIAMVPSANLLGFAGQELARKLPKVFGRSFSFSQECLDTNWD